MFKEAPGFRPERVLDINLLQVDDPRPDLEAHDGLVAEVPLLEQLALVAPQPRANYTVLAMSQGAA